MARTAAIPHLHFRKDTTRDKIMTQTPAISLREKTSRGSQNRRQGLELPQARARILKPHSPRGQIGVRIGVSVWGVLAMPDDSRPRRGPSRAHSHALAPPSAGIWASAAPCDYPRGHSGQRECTECNLQHATTSTSEVESPISVTC